MLLADTKRRPHHGLRRRRAEQNDQARLDQLDLRLEPRPAGADLRRVRLLMEAPFAAAGEAKVLHGVGHVDPPAVDPSLVQSLLQHPSRGTDERTALQVFLVPRLLADEPPPGAFMAFAEDGL